jgi:hypothetical protein
MPKIEACRRQRTPTPPWISQGPRVTMDAKDLAKNTYLTAIDFYKVNYVIG